MSTLKSGLCFAARRQLSENHSNNWSTVNFAEGSSEIMGIEKSFKIQTRFSRAAFDLDMKHNFGVDQNY